MHTFKHHRFSARAGVAHFGVHTGVSHLGAWPGMHSNINRFSLHTGSGQSETFFYQLLFSKRSLGHDAWSGINTYLGCIAHQLGAWLGTGILGFFRPAVGFRSQNSIRGFRVYRVRARRWPLRLCACRLLWRFLAAAAAAATTDDPLTHRITFPANIKQIQVTLGISD